MSSTTRLLLFFCALQLCVWGVVAPAFHAAIPLDVAELAIFANEGVIANYKHPNLPGLILQLGVWLTGTIEVAYLLSQFSIVGAYVAIYLLSRDFLSERKALLSVLLVSTIFYYHWPTPEFNHNILQIPLWAWATFLSWRAVNTHRLIYWLLLGVVAGAMVWTKYSSGILLFWIFIWLIACAEGRRTFKTPGPYVSVCVFSILVAPQLHYLVSSEFLPLEYAARRASDGEIVDSAKFVISQLGNHLFFIVLLLLGGLVGKGALIPAEVKDAEVTRFLILVAVLPVVTVTLLPILTGKGLRSMWGTPMFNFSALLLLYFFGGRVNTQRLRRVAVGAVVLLPLIAALYIAQHLWRADFSDKPMRTLWPQEEMAEYFDAEYQTKTGEPIRLIAASDWLGGLLASGSKFQPRVIIDGDSVKSPWMNQVDIMDVGALIVWQGIPDASLRDFAESLGVDMGNAESAEFLWHPVKADKPIVIQYISVPPRNQLRPALQ